MHSDIDLFELSQYLGFWYWYFVALVILKGTFGLVGGALKGGSQTRDRFAMCKLL
jgi:hypothetical protein